MIARIFLKNGYYDSIVFALRNKFWGSEILVFNSDFTDLQFVQLYIPDGKAFIYNAEKEGWKINKKIEGYEWILENLRKKPFRNKISKDILHKCKELQATVKECEWFEIKNNSDIDGLMLSTMRFHDSYVKKMYVSDDKQYIDFDTTWGYEILFELDGNIETNLFEDYGAIIIDNEFFHIFCSTMFFENNLIYWVDEHPLKSSDEIHKIKAYYFCAKNVKWKLSINKSKHNVKERLPK